MKESPSLLDDMWSDPGIMKRALDSIPIARAERPLIGAMVKTDREILCFTGQKWIVDKAMTAVYAAMLDAASIRPSAV